MIVLEAMDKVILQQTCVFLDQYIIGKSYIGKKADISDVTLIPISTSM